MVYSEKAEENRESAELCLHSAKYNAAASRYYYSLFLLAKGILAQSRFDYRGFLRESEHVDGRQRSHNVYSHGTIHIALATYLNFDVEKFTEEWDRVYKYRISADYKDKRITKKDIDKCRKIFYSIHRRIHNGRI